MRHDDNIPVARGNLAQQAAAVLDLKIFLACGQHLGAGVEPVHIGSPLLNQVVRHHDHRFLGQTHAAALHGARNAGEGLASSHGMVDQHEALVDAAPDGVELVAAHPDDGIGHLAGQLQVLAVVLPGHAGVENLVVDGHQAFAARGVGKHPVGKLRLDLLDLEVGQVRQPRVDLGVAVAVLVGHGG